MARKSKQPQITLENVEYADESINNGSSVEIPELKVTTPTYYRGVDGSIDWRKMIKPEYIVLNTQYKEQLEKMTGKLFNEINHESVDDKYKLILLAGFKEVAALRGYKSVDYTVVTAHPEYVAVKCTIQWEKKEEDTLNNQEFLFSALADAKASSDQFVARYPMATAENRAFCRAVRSALRIHIVGKDEIDFSQKVEPTVDRGISKTGPVGAILEKLKTYGKTFSDFAKWWSDTKNPLASEWKSPQDIPQDEAWIILAELKKLEEKN